MLKLSGKIKLNLKKIKKQRAMVNPLTSSFFARKKRAFNHLPKGTYFKLSTDAPLSIFIIPASVGIMKELASRLSTLNFQQEVLLKLFAFFNGFF